MFVACVVLMEAIMPCFNLSPDDCNLATTILVPQTLSVAKNTAHIGKSLVGISAIGMGLWFSKIHPGSISDFNITEKNSM